MCIFAFQSILASLSPTRQCCPAGTVLLHEARGILSKFLGCAFEVQKIHVCPARMDVAFEETLKGKGVPEDLYLLTGE